MPTGYVLPDPRPDVSYEEFHSRFRWQLPEEYNIASASFDHGDDVRSGTALYHVDESGGHHEFSYEALDRASDALARELNVRGVSAGDHVAICFPQSPELLLAHLACYKLEAVTVPVSMLLGDDALSYTLSHSDADLLLVETAVMEGFEDSAFDPIERVHDIPLNSDEYGPDTSQLGGYLDFVGQGPSRAGGTGDIVPTTGPDDPAILLYTSGTSGKPKGVLHGHRYLIGSLPGYHLWFHLFGSSTYPKQRVWTPSEWAWAGALFDVVFPTLAIGGTVVSYTRRSKFDPKAALDLVDDTGVTRAFMPPTSFSLIRDAVPEPDTTLPTLEVVQSGGEQLSPAVSEWAQEQFDLVINEGYGQTEANALVGNCQQLFDWRPGSMGRPYPGHEIRILDENDDPVPTGELGELAVEGPDPVFFLEYWNDSEATAEKFTDDGLLRTGDMVFRDEDGYVWFQGRNDDLIITSGYRVSPVEIEDALEDHPLVAEAVVGGVPDSDRGERIKAFLFIDADKNLTAEDTETLREFVRDRIGAHKTPHEFEVLTDIPQTRSGKVDRSVLFPDEAERS